VLLVFRSAFELDANSSFLHTREDGHPDIAGYVGDFSVVSTVLKKAYPGVCTQKVTIPIILFIFGTYSTWDIIRTYKFGQCRIWHTLKYYYIPPQSELYVRRFSVQSRSRVKAQIICLPPYSCSVYGRALSSLSHLVE
jgi:hypothetical protein